MMWSAIIAVVFGALILCGCDTPGQKAIATGWETTTLMTDPVAPECRSAPGEKDIPRPAVREYSGDESALEYARLRKFTKGTVRAYNRCATWANGQRPRSK